MPSDSDFIAEIQAHPHDELPRLIYADWLEDQDDPRAEYLRLESELSGLNYDAALYREFRDRLLSLREECSDSWLAEIGRTRVDCDRNQCPKQWIHLKALKVAGYRLCDVCQKPVQFSRFAKPKSVTEEALGEPQSVFAVDYVALRDEKFRRQNYE